MITDGSDTIVTGHLHYFTIEGKAIQYPVSEEQESISEESAQSQNAMQLSQKFDSAAAVV